MLYYKLCFVDNDGKKNFSIKKDIDDIESNTLEAAKRLQQSFCNYSKAQKEPLHF